MFGQAQHQRVYATIAELVYVPAVTPDFGYVHWRPDYELGPLEAAYSDLATGTRDFLDVSPADLERVIRSHPPTLQVFRLILGLTSAEFAEASSVIGGTTRLSKSTIRKIETGSLPSSDVVAVCAAVIHQMMNGRLFPTPLGDGTLRSKIDKPDTARGWESVRQYAADGVPLPMFLHQRAYGGSFRQLLGATSTKRGDVLEIPVEETFQTAGIPYLRTGSHNQAEITTRFQLTLRPAPDFVIFDNRSDGLRAILECKGTNDGGTARDKAARFAALRTEATRSEAFLYLPCSAGSDGVGPVML